jgi:hypothetical protein
MNVASLARYAPILKWGRTYDRNALTGDLLAAVIVTIMLIPQSLAYALLAGLPPEAGLYASIAPIILYAIFGTSRALAVGPVAVVSLTAAAIWKYRRPRHHGLRRCSPDPGGTVGRDPAGDGTSETWVPYQLPFASRHRRFYHRIGHPNRDQPDQAYSGHQRGRRYPAGNGNLAGSSQRVGISPSRNVIRRPSAPELSDIKFCLRSVWAKNETVIENINCDLK